MTNREKIYLIFLAVLHGFANFLVSLYMYSVWCYHDYLAAVAGPALFLSSDISEKYPFQMKQDLIFSHCC